MARPRSKKSKLSFSGIGLDKHEEEQLIARLDERDISFRWLQRKLVRDWLKEAKALPKKEII